MQQLLASAKFRATLKHDIILIGIMAVLAACGLIYEYLLSHYAGRVIGAMDSAIYSMIGIMIVAMGIGAFLAKWIKDPFTGFTCLELLIGLLGGTSILIIASIISISYTLPQELQAIYGLHPSITTDGGIIQILQNVVYFIPFICGFVLGVLIGMEIPLIARIREIMHGQHLAHNIGTIYGADYIGAGIGAAIWVVICLKQPIIVSAIGTASINTLMGMVFLYHYQSHIKKAGILWGMHFALIVLLIVLSFVGIKITDGMNSSFFKDSVAYTKVTPYQHITLTKRNAGKSVQTVYSLYINGRLQFSSNDEAIYHSYLTYPALLSSARQDHILVIGGGDGMAVRDILKWDPETVTLIDLDRDMTNLFSGKDKAVPEHINKALLALNKNAFLDERVKIINADAFIEVENMITKQKRFDTIIVDLPDPSHPDLNKLYSNYFYLRLKELLQGDGAIVIQSTSPYHAKKAFLSVGKTLADAGLNTQQYHANVPTFGEWGWTIGTVLGRNTLDRINAVETLPVADPWISKEQLLAAFVFSPSFYQNIDDINVNELGSYQVYHYHHEAWASNDGLFLMEK